MTALHRSIRYALAALRTCAALGAAACVAWLAAPSAFATTLPAGFSETNVITGLSAPNSFAFTPDNRILVCQQGGALGIFDLNGAPLGTGTALTLACTSNSERGLLGIAIDQNFSSNGYIYLYYTTSSGSLNPPGTPKNRVSRFTMSGNAVVGGSEVILLDLIPSDAGNHNGGQLRIGPHDGKLYISTGDGGSTPSNSQSRTTLAGKILRLNLNGTIPSDNPFFNDPTPGIRKEIWCYGLRNPWRFTIQPGTNALFIADVGQNTWEEVNIGVPGANYGWPTAEGNSTNSNFTNPVFVYNHGGNGASITGGAFYTGTTFPTEYQNCYFYGDYVDNYIRRLVLSPTNEVIADEAWGTGANGPVNIEYFDNAIWFTAINSGHIRRITYAAGANRSPVAMASATPIAGLAPFTVTFSSAGTVDPDNDALTYLWDFGDSTSSSAPNPTHQYSGAPQTVTARLTVTDNGSPNLSDTSVGIPIVIGTSPPTATIVSPAANAMYNAGQTISFSGTGTDPEDGARPASAFTWRVVFHHGEHTHPFLGPITGTTSGNFVIPDTGETATDVWYEIILTVRDSNNVPDTETVLIFPNVGNLQLRTVPAGLDVTVDGQPMTTPLNTASVVGMKRQLGITLPQTIGGTTYTTFSGWSDGGAQDHQIVTPAGTTTYAVVAVAADAPSRIPMGGDWDASGASSIGLYFRSAGTFALRNSNSPGAADFFFGYGPANPGWIPLTGDWDGNNSRTPGLYDPASS
ncbi:MAG: PQQ-dependent sugar dehydrogenase, partial [Acidobacteria bacterium]|nr:PQQ-dependent sugar dehydrogenase [Acidobacteriota bacterium]